MGGAGLRIGGQHRQHGGRVQPQRGQPAERRRLPQRGPVGGGQQPGQRLGQLGGGRGERGGERVEAAPGGGCGGERQQPLAEREPRTAGAQRAGVGGEGEQSAGGAGQLVGPPEHVALVLLAVGHGQPAGPGPAGGGQLGQGVEGVTAAAHGAAVEHP
ncbi:hypothetical protein [Kitasatospora aureofaciens]|uniref:hypothetical protein n=1 Tax=Kitasatospora aureofaciens TaxID=1894 RepID=UPI001F0B6CA1|nr:hypothetical protein [Kitasatospora aureofaciens]